MMLPKWNNEWEKPDPLRGQLGWSRHHYAAVVVAAILLVTVFGLVVPFVGKARQKERELDEVYKQFTAAMTRAAGGMRSREW